MNNQSNKPEKLEPKDSNRKHIKQAEDSEAVTKPENQVYKKKEADFKNIAKRKENQEQPVYPVKDAPRETKK